MGVIPVIVIVALLALVVRISSDGSLFGAVGFIIIILLPIAILSSWTTWKKGLIKVVDKEKKND